MIDLVRALASDHVSQRGVARADAAKGRDSAPVRSPNAVASIRERLQEMVGGVDPDDPEAMRKARSMAVREILLWEFGEDFGTDPEFLSIHKAIDDLMASDPRAAAGFDSMVKALNRQ